MTYFFKKPFGENGDITQIPVNDQGDGNVSYEKGWPEGYELDPNIDPEEARNLSRTNFNGLFFNITNALKELQEMGVKEYITSAENGGTNFPYPEGGMCYYRDPVTNKFGVYLSIRGNNTQVPSLNGITSKDWQLVMSPDWDTLKSNRVSNVPLYYEQQPTVDIDTESNTVTVTFYTGTKILLPRGIAEDGSYNNEIYQIDNDLSYTHYFNLGGINTHMLITSDGQLQLIPNKNFITSDDLLNQTNYDESEDYYYFDKNANLWKILLAGSEEWTDLDYSLVEVGTLNANDVNSVSVMIENVLQLIDQITFNEELGKKQESLNPSKYITISHVKDGESLIDINLPSTATSFCANNGNVNGSLEADLFSTDSILLPNTTENMLTYGMTNCKIATYVSGNNYTVPLTKRRIL